MKPKKVIMILILIAFVIAIGFIVVKVNNKSQETVENKTENVANKMQKNETVNELAGQVRNTMEEAKKTSTKVLEITDNFFIEQTTDMYLNLEDYIGKTVKIEGLIYQYQDDNGDICYAVVRNTPGCCGNDGLAGVDIRYDGEYPKIDTWVEVQGVIGKDIVFGEEVPAIRVSSIKETAKGKTFVTN